MADIVVINKLSKRKRRCTLAAIGILSLFGGVEYALILPTLYLRLATYNAPGFYLGLVISAYSFSGLFVSPIMGRIYDKTRKSKILISFTNIVECIGSIMYWMGLSPLFLIMSRLVAGLGNGYFPIILAEVTHGTSNEARTSMVSTVMAMRQFGLLLGPGFNLFLTKMDFNIGPFKVDQYSSPGLFLAALWVIAQLIVTFLYFPMTKLIPAGDLNEETPPSDPDLSSSSDSTKSLTHEPNGIVDSKPEEVTNYKQNGIASVEENGTAAHESVPDHIKEAEEYDEVHSLQHRSLKQALLDITYEEYMAIYMLTFVSLFNQCGMETMFTPLASKFFGWQEEQISILFCLAGVLILISFFMVHICSKRFRDRTLIIFGSLCQVVTLAYCLYWIPHFHSNSDVYLQNTLILLPALAVNVFGLPFLFVCHISLFSKLLHRDIQGFGHGTRRIIAGIAAILGPLWASSLLDDHLLMFGVMLGLNILALLLILLSYKKLNVADNVEPPSEQVVTVEPEKDVNERTKLIN